MIIITTRTVETTIKIKIKQKQNSENMNKNHNTANNNDPRRAWLPSGERPKDGV